MHFAMENRAARGVKKILLTESAQYCGIDMNQTRFAVTTQASHFSNAKHTILSPEGGENSVFRGKY